MINYTNCTNKLAEFWSFVKVNKLRKIKFILTLGILLLIPTQSRALQENIVVGRPVVRSLPIELTEFSSYPVNITGQAAPWLTARAALAIDVPSKTIIFSKNQDYRLLPASTTKIMTALVALDFYKLNDVLDVATPQAIGQTMGLKENEKMTAENLLYGLLVESGNDAAYVFAENYPGGVDDFVAAMNKKAADLNLKQTSFHNPTGIDASGHLTTAHDLALLAAEAMKNDIFAKIVATPSIVISDTSGDIKHKLTNINQLVGKFPGVKGIKTGWTEDAGECLVAYTERDKGKIITVVLGSNNRFKETEVLVDWVFNNFQWEAILPPS